MNVSGMGVPGPALPVYPAVDFGHIRCILGKRERAKRAPAKLARPCTGHSAALLEAALSAVEATTGFSVRTADGPSPRVLAARVARAVVLVAEKGRTPGALALVDEDAVHCELATRAALRRCAVGSLSELR